jgi:ubiquinone/menaquinone biosynthesis C-methylase UbiE
LIAIVRPETSLQESLYGRAERFSCFFHNLDQCREQTMSNTKLLYKRESDLLRALSNFWDRLIARRALFLADEPTTVLDSPCGDGRFWPLLAEKRDRKIIATDKSATMLVSAWNANPSKVVERVRLHASSFAIGLADESVECIFSMHPFQGVDDASARLDLLREFHRITRDCFII